MKKVAIILMVLTIGIGSASAAAIGGSFKFGRSSKNCTGFGICSFSIDFMGFHFEYGTKGGGGESIAVQTSVDESKNTYTLTFSINDLRQKDPTKTTELDKGKFYVDEDITLPNDANRSYGLRRTTPIILKAGTYDVRKNGDTATIVIDIK